MTSDQPATGRDRAVLVAAAVVLAVAVVGAVVLLTRDGDGQTLSQAPLTPSATEPPAEPTAAPTAEPTVQPTATTTPEPSATPGPAGWELSAAYLTPEQASAAEQSGWTVDADHEPGAGPLLDPCGENAFPRADAVAASGERALRSTREAGGSLLVQEVFRYADGAAAAAFDAYVERVARCPEAPSSEAPEGYTRRYEVVERGDVRGARTALVQVQPCDDQARCVEHFRSYLLLAQAGDGLSTAS